MRYVISLICLALVAFWPAGGGASTVGKINGVVRDATGAPLPGANVVIRGTPRGATTDGEGYFLILSVGPGSYELAASMVGYTEERRINVMVQGDFTTRVDFSLMEATLEMGEMIVVAERPPVEPDRTTSRYVMDMLDIEQVVLARSTSELIRLQPGVSLDGLRVRGSDVSGAGSQNESFVQIDGVKLVNNDGYGKGNFMGINRMALQEVTVVTGGMNAEYGNAQAGVLSLVTRESRGGYAGSGEYRLSPPGKKHWGSNIYDSAIHQGRIDWTDQAFLNEVDPLTGQKIHERTNYTGVWGHVLEGSLLGPIFRDMGFFLSARSSQSPTTYPSPLKRQPFNIQTSWNTTYRPGSDVKVKLGGVHAYYKSFDGSGGPGSVRGIGESGLNLFLPSGVAAAGEHRQHETALYGILTHLLSPKTFYDVRISYQRSLNDTSMVPEATGDVRRDSKGFYLTRDFRNFTYRDLKRWIVKADITSQLSKGHLVKGGFEATRYSLYLHEETFADTRSRNIRMVGKGDIVLGMEPFHPTLYGLYVQDKMEFEGLVVNAGLRLDVLAPGESYGRAAETVLWNHYNSFTRWRNVPTEDSPLQKAKSYRLGISHPITDRAIIRFFTGTFYQFVDMQMLYTRVFRSTRPDVDLNKNGVIDQMELYNTLVYPLAGEFGFVDMKPERTTSFEVGSDWNFAGDYIASITAFYKDQEGKLHSSGQGQYLDEPVLGFNASYAQAKKNSGLQSSRGAEISLKKRFNQYTTFNLSYNIQWVKSQGHAGLREWEWFIVPDSSYVAGGKFFVGVTVRDDGQEVPRPPTEDEIRHYGAAANQIVQRWLNRVGEPKGAGFIESPLKLEPGLYAFTDSHYSEMLLRGGIDRRNYGSVHFLFSTPSDFNLKLLSNVRMTMVYLIHTGTPYNYTPPTGPQQRRNTPLSTVTDVSLEKDARFGKNAVVTGFLEVRNLWNQKDDMTAGFNWVQYGLQMPVPGDSRYEQFGDINEQSRYNGGLGRPRHINVGLRLKF